MYLKNNSKYNPIDKTNEIFDIVKKYSPTAELICGENYRTIRAVNSAGIELVIDIENEITIFFGNWHDHYYADLSEYELCIDNLNDIFNNKKFTVCAYLKDRAVCVFLSETDKPNVDELREEVGSDKIIICSFWDSSKNVTFDAEL